MFVCLAIAVFRWESYVRKQHAHVDHDHDVELRSCSFLCGLNPRSDLLLDPFCGAQREKVFSDGNRGRSPEVYPEVERTPSGPRAVPQFS